MLTATSIQQVQKDVDDRMKKALATVTRELGEIRGGRANPGMVENMTVDYYGAPTPLKQLAAITAPEARLLVIQPWDAKAVVEIEKAVQKSGLGITPVVDGKLIRLPIPALTGDRRNDLIKLVHKVAEEGRVSMRSIRRDANEATKKLKSANQATEDDVFKMEADTQKVTDRYIGQIDALVKQKESELSSA
jgi:ribosome recycling factor